MITDELIQRVNGWPAKEKPGVNPGGTGGAAKLYRISDAVAASYCSVGSRHQAQAHVCSGRLHCHRYHLQAVMISDLMAQILTHAGQQIPGKNPVFI